MRCMRRKGRSSRIDRKSRDRSVPKQAAVDLLRLNTALNAAMDAALTCSYLLAVGGIKPTCRSSAV